MTRDPTYLSAELFNAITQAVWDQPPPHVYYSSAAQQIVTDYFWFEALAWGMVRNGQGESTGQDTAAKDRHVNVNNNNFNHPSGETLSYSLHRKRNFRQASFFPRLRLLQVAEELLVRAARATYLLDTLGGFDKVAETGGAGANSRSSSRYTRGGRGGGPSNAKAASLTRGELDRTIGLFQALLQSFLQQMHTVGTAFSHAEYADGLDLLRAAESSLLSLESELHSSELRASVKHSNMFQDSRGNPLPGAVSVECKEKYSNIYHNHDEGDGEGGASSRTWGHALKVVLTSSLADYFAICSGLIMGVGGMSGYVYLKGGSSRRRFVRSM
jgi:hypothetical protein